MNTQSGHGPPNEPPKAGFVTVFLVTDGGEKPFKIHPGEWQVEKLKRELGIPEALLLIEVTTPLIEHEDSGKLHVYEGEKFLGQTREGQTS
jgi:hypothetical protein